MCGYCIEYNFLTLVKTNHQCIFQFENCQPDDETIIPDDIYFNYYIQEFENLSEVLKITSKFDRFKSCFYFILSRLIEENVQNGFDASLVDLIDTLFNFKSIEIINILFRDSYRDEYLKERNGYYNNQLLFNLYDHRLYTDEKVWHKFVSDKNFLMSRCTEILRFYYEWLFGSEDFIKSHRVDYYLLILNVFLALAYLSHCDTESEIINKIALNAPPFAPGPYAEELWIQRKAFLHCVKRYGVEFITQNYKQYIRPELIYYALLKLQINYEHLDQLKNLLKDDLEVFSFGMAPKEVLELIADLSSQSV